jgi:hypothetical protein
MPTRTLASALVELPRVALGEQFAAVWQNSETANPDPVGV